MVVLRSLLVFETGLPETRFSLQWDLGDGTVTDAFRFDHIYDAVGVYEVELIITDECLDKVDTIYRKLEVSKQAALAVGPDLEVCEGQAVRFVAFDNGSDAYIWNGPNGFTSSSLNANIDVATLTNSGTYEVFGIKDGCESELAEIDLGVRPSPKPSLGRDTLVCSRNEVEFILDPGEFNFYAWQDNTISPTMTVREEGEYRVRVRDDLGCFGFDTLYVTDQCPTIVFLPNIFTPNEDDYNDHFFVQGDEIISFHLQVYNRWGGLVYETREVEPGWDGTFNGQNAQTGVYTWILNYEGYEENGKVQSKMEAGTVTLIR